VPCSATTSLSLPGIALGSGSPAIATHHLRIPLKAAAESTRSLPLIPGESCRLSERSGAGDCIVTPPRRCASISRDAFSWTLLWWAQRRIDAAPSAQLDLWLDGIFDAANLQALIGPEDPS